MQHQSFESFFKITQELIDLISASSPEQINISPFAGSWTIAQVGEHLLKSYGIAEILNGNTIESNTDLSDENINKLKKIFLNFDVKMQSPSFILPSEGWIDKESLISNLQSRINEVAAFIKNNTDFSRICLDFQLPGSSPFTQAEWIHFMTFHTERHVHQIKNILAHLQETIVKG